MERPKIFKGRTKEWDTDNWQGKTREQLESNYKVMFLALVGMLVMVIGTVLWDVIKHLF
tara:strand:- start:435 stop:611 length:177 start_codon:yes stop_codon:yes gene_type:complete